MVAKTLPMQVSFFKISFQYFLMIIFKGSFL
jgi:hypothetical protein